ncbi:LOW QUALITY PROTEIN: uncharacterized protein LOC103721505 [Phoenix dactylifera]|uniref:LOW QUALITY PROTEIN: uncharacterized protein LOC103721505 n=1 Tax=Phoenix dactylifera TaxID=42345 RepID=A0A8B8JC97_PHODC|nr:LOW QUALITY PROTEIN: uncharacterized protein LOC103721505 [Phoenix dactylifera]
MESAAKSSSVKNVVVRVLLFGVFVLIVRFVYVVTVYGGPCNSGDFCLLPFPGEGLSVTSAGGGASAGSAAFVRVADGSTGATPALWTTREWRKAVDYYSAVFQDLLVDGFVSPTAKSLCVDTPTGHEVLALKEIGVLDAVGVAKKKAPPLVVAGGDLLHLPFRNGTFDFVFAGRSLDRSKRLAHLASEIVRTLKPDGFLAVLTASAGNAYSLHSLIDLFPSFWKLRFRKLDGPDSSSAIHEIVFQKQLDGDILAVDGKEAEDSSPSSSCSIPEHKLRLLESAEPLIKEEPLKPWIALKRNIKNIKYLPSMVDISFKPRYVYVDVGARSYGSSIGSWFRKQYPKQNHTFDIYAIEADPAFHDEYAAKKNVNLLPFAAWVRNETLAFEINHDPEQHDVEKEKGGRGMGRIRPVSRLSGGVSSGEVHSIHGFDFAKWLKRTVSESDFVVMKMDVEGTEFDLVPRLFETGAICLIDELFLECHYNRWQRCCPGERTPKYRKTYGECLKLFTSLRKSGVLVHQWW